MSGGGAVFGHSGGGAYGGKITTSGKSSYRIELDALYGEGWETKVLKTLEQELKERGIMPRIGDDAYQIIPTPRLLGDRVSLGMVCTVIAFLGICACWAWWEYLPDDGSPFYTQRTR